MATRKNLKFQDVFVVIFSVLAETRCQSLFYQKRLLAKAWPEPDLRYFSKGAVLQSFFGERSTGGCFKIFLKFQSFPLISKSNSSLDFPRDVFGGMFTFPLIMSF